MNEDEAIKKLQEMIGLCTEAPKHIAYNEQRAIETILDLYKKTKKELDGIYNDYQDLGKEYYKLQTELEQEKEKNKELELEKEINQEAINIANNQLCNYELGYQAGLHKEITATELAIRNRENFIIQSKIKRLEDKIYELHKTIDEGNEIVKQEYISKDKIREFIKKETFEGTYSFDLISAKRLQELLEEN